MSLPGAGLPLLEFENEWLRRVCLDWADEHILGTTTRTCDEITVYNIPAGDNGYILQYLEKKKDNLIKGFDIFENLLDP